MGLERNAAALLLKLKADGVAFGRTLTLGHQHTHLDLHLLQRFRRRLGLPPVPAVPTYADDLLIALGATSVDSLDVSDYEGATIIHDLNEPIPAEWRQQFDLVFDGGTLEHVFNFPVAIKNCMQMVRQQGHFVSVTIPNNWCGHGFYQFSPELFFRVLGPESGFSIVEMYVVDIEGRRCYAVTDPAIAKSRVELRNCEPVFLMIHARRDVICDVLATTPQQSDYVNRTADRRPTSRPSAIPPAWKQLPGIRHLGTMRQRLLARRRRRFYSLRNRDFYRPVDLTI